MATKAKKELDISIPASKKKVTIDKSALDSITIDTGISVETIDSTGPSVKPPKTGTKLTEQSELTVNADLTPLITELAELNANFTKLHNNMEKVHALAHSTDWKMWKIMNVVELIAKENGYVFVELPSLEIEEKENLK